MLVLKQNHLPGGSDGKESACQCSRPRFDSWVGKIPWRRKWQSTPAFLPGEFHEQRSLAGYSLWGHKESDTTEWYLKQSSADKKRWGFWSPWNLWVPKCDGVGPQVAHGHQKHLQRAFSLSWPGVRLSGQGFAEGLTTGLSCLPGDSKKL